MPQTLTAKHYIGMLLLAVMVLVLPTQVAFASIEEFFFTKVVWPFFSWLVTLGGTVLNYGLNSFVIGFGEQYAQQSIGGTVEELWRLFRDLFNLTFIFGLVYIGFKMILRTDDGQTRRWLVQLILAALLVNFSLFFAKFIIDFSNILAVEIMNENATIFEPMPYEVLPGVPITGVDLSMTMQQQTGLVTINENTGDIAEMNYQEGAGFVYIFGTMILLLVTAFVYLAAGILLIIRGAVLLLLMAVSPFLFLGWVLPSFQNFSRGLWSQLLSRAFMAPIYVALIYMTMSIAEGFTGGGSFGEAFTADPANKTGAIAGSFGPFAIVITFLLASLIAAQKLGVEGAGKAIQMGQSARKYAQKNLVRRPARAVGRGARRGAGAAGGAAVGAGAAATRRSLGRLAYNVGNNKKLASGGVLGRTTAAAAAKVGQASFDPRSKTGGVLGKKKGGYAATVKDAEKKEKERAKKLEQNPYDENGNETDEYKQYKAEKLDDKNENYDAQYKGSLDELAAATADKSAADALVNSSEEELAAQLETNKELAELRNEIASADNDQDRLAAQQLLAERENQLKGQYRQQNAAVYAQQKEAARELETKQNAVKQEETRVEGDYKYQYVDALKEQRQKESQNWSDTRESFNYTASAGVGVGTGAAIGTALMPGIGTAIGAAIGAAAGVATRASVGAAAETSKARVAQITDEYGKDGRKKVKNQGQRKFLKELTEQMKEYEGGENSDAADSTNDSSKSDESTTT